MAKLRTKYVCNECGYETGKWLGKCTSCGVFGSLEEEIISDKHTKSAPSYSSAKKAVLLKDIKPMQEARIKTNISELDRVLGGGIVQGSLTLVGGDPGIGKSTLLLQICQLIGDQDKKILYASGEESVYQIKLRAKRLGVSTENLYLVSETNLNTIEAISLDLKPDLIIIDSIQTMFIDEISSAAGSITQTRECTSKIMKLAKKENISIIIVGHVTKEGNLAGPRVLEHMVDTVLYFEGEKIASYRILRAVKNRFGSTNEIGVFEMKQNGLKEILNPSEYMLAGRPVNASGSVISCSIEGTRPILCETQSLVSYTTFNMPRRMVTGVDFNRMTFLAAVLEKKLGYQLGSYDIYVNLTGGLKILEPALDAGIITSIASSYKNKVINQDTIIFGEIGLAGEIRAVSFSEKRVLEAVKLNFKTIILPKDNLKEVSDLKDVKIKGISNVNQLLELVLV